MTAKIPPGPRSASLLPALVAVRGCAPRSHRTGPPTPAQATKPAPRREAPAKPRIVRPHNRAVPILMYHVVGTAPPDAPYPGLYVRRADFAGQLAWLRAHGYHEDFTNVRPLLARRHWPAVLNLAVRNLLDGKLTTPQIKLMIRQGWEIDAHTINHVDLTTLSSSDLRHEVAGSRTWIRRRFHVPAGFFCYPSGRYDARVVAAVRAAGFFGAT